MLTIDAKVRQKYPGIQFGVMTIGNVKVPQPGNDFLLSKKRLEADIQSRYRDMTKKQMRQLQPFCHYHAYYKKFKKTYHVLHQCESIASGNRSLPNGPFPVQAMFMAEIKNQLLTAGYDRRTHDQTLTVRLADGLTGFEGLGKKKQLPPRDDIILSTGEFTLGSIICGPDNQHRITEESTELMFAIYGVPGITHRQMEMHFADIENFILSSAKKAAVKAVEIA